MAAIETPWLASMSPSSTYNPEDGPSTPSYDPNPPTTAVFSPQSLSGAATTSKQRSTIIVHKKSPLLVATPPPVTRALAYSHPYILPLNKLAGLLSWTSDDPWESFLLVAAFWALTLYGNELLLWAAPILVAIGLILGMYSRRYSPLSSTSQTGEKHGHKREPSEVAVTHHKTIDEIVETLRVFTTRCNLLLDPLKSMTEFLSTQRTATSATTRPALTILFFRMIFVTPVWILLTLPPFYIITTRRLILTVGTLALTWHSRPARVSRVILWRSLAIRRLCSFVTGLSFSNDPSSSKTSKLAVPNSLNSRKKKSQENIASELATKHRPASPGVRFTFILYENQRRWIGLGWTSAMLAYERASWTDEHLNSAPNRDQFELPSIDSGSARWRWVKASTWKIEGGASTSPSEKRASKGSKTDAAHAEPGDGGGWIYYDNKWNDGKRDADSWGKYTRRRKWFRDAELVEVTSSMEVTPSATPNDPTALSEAETESTSNSRSKPNLSTPKKSPGHKKSASSLSLNPPTPNTGIDGTADYPEPPDTTNSTKSTSKRKSWFTKGKDRDRERRGSKSSSLDKKSGESTLSARTDPGEDHLDRWKNGDDDPSRKYGLGEDVVMGLS